MSSKKHVVNLHLPADLHTKLKSHANTEMRSYQKQIIFILQSYATEKNLPSGGPVAEDLDFVDE